MQRYLVIDNIYCREIEVKAKYSVDCRECIHARRGEGSDHTARIITTTKNHLPNRIQRWDSRRGEMWKGDKLAVRIKTGCISRSPLQDLQEMYME